MNYNNLIGYAILFVAISSCTSPFFDSANNLAETIDSLNPIDSIINPVDTIVNPIDSIDESFNGTVFKLYFAAGQSNMEGFGEKASLNSNYLTPHSSVMIFTGQDAADDVLDVAGIGKWLPLSVGFGNGYYASLDTVLLSNRFGPELSFGHKMAENSKEKIAIIKYSRGGSSLALGVSGYGTWDKNYNNGTTINQWDHFTATVNNALSQKDIDGDGIEDKLIPSGIIWMQGEADAGNEWGAYHYVQNFNKFAKDLREFIGVNDLPIVICRIEDSGETSGKLMMPYLEILRDAQKQIIQSDPKISLIELSKPISFRTDRWHYESAHYIEMGIKFAEKLK